MKIEYLSHIQKAFVDLMECIEVKSDNPSDPSRLAVRMKYRLKVIYLFTFCRLCLPCMLITAELDVKTTVVKVLLHFLIS